MGLSLRSGIPLRHTKNKKFKWVLYARKLRNKNLNINT